jgi:hypothetical protein
MSSSPAIPLDASNGDVSTIGHTPGAKTGRREHALAPTR